MYTSRLLFKRAFLVIWIEMVHVSRKKFSYYFDDNNSNDVMRMIQSWKVVKWVQVSVLVVLTMIKGQEISLPGGQTQPSVQWSSQSADRSGLLHVSEQGEPHSWYCMLKGHNLAESRKSIIMLIFLLKCWENSICNLGCFLSRYNEESWSKWRLQHFRLSDIY